MDERLTSGGRWCGTIPCPGAACGTGGHGGIIVRGPFFRGGLTHVSQPMRRHGLLMPGRRDHLTMRATGLLAAVVRCPGERPGFEGQGRHTFQRRSKAAARPRRVHPCFRSSPRGVLSRAPALRVELRPSAPVWGGSCDALPGRSTCLGAVPLPSTSGVAAVLTGIKITAFRARPQCMRFRTRVGGFMVRTRPAPGPHRNLHPVVRGGMPTSIRKPTARPKKAAARSSLFLCGGERFAVLAEAATCCLRQGFSGHHSSTPAPLAHWFASAWRPQIPPAHGRFALPGG